MEGLSSSQFTKAMWWLDWYIKHKEYKRVGKLKGVYYDDLGNPTELKRNVEQVASQVKEMEERDEQEQRLASQFPSWRIFDKSDNV